MTREGIDTTSKNGAHTNTDQTRTPRERTNEQSIDRSREHQPLTQTDKQSVDNRLVTLTLTLATNNKQQHSTQTDDTDDRMSCAFTSLFKFGNIRVAVHDAVDERSTCHVRL